eukprot:CAMPEP_0178971072 /NCGR_PEP_ID=MMETSP0789-20121207/20020_1 /TAXON_ID=3005 /ORGANISM="Rhizosolenia setigera, Strain CCMP 1694" /LENGTH=358 /DNA_ID=CAMNT_0020657899 /DNA_START=104 /DNA_END=1180 /DNA_ORIENTATION=-
MSQLLQALMFIKAVSCYEQPLSSHGEEYNVEDEDEISDQDVEQLVTSIFLGLVVILLFILYIKLTQQHNPNKTNDRDRNRHANNTHRHYQQQQQQYRNTQQTMTRRANVAVSQAESGEDLDENGFPSPNMASQFLVEGIKPWRHGPARQFKLPPDLNDMKGEILDMFNDKAMMTVREDQQEQQSSQQTANNSNPNTASATADLSQETFILSKGSNIVLTLREEDLSNDQQTQSKIKSICNTLTIIGSEYNLFLIVDFSSSVESTNTKKLESKLDQIKNGITTPQEILPKHRIVAAQSIIGKVAFVRQLRPHLVVDHDVEVKKQLSRFGFRVVVYDNKKNEDGDDCINGANSGNVPFFC